MKIIKSHKPIEVCSCGKEVHLKVFRAFPEGSEIKGENEIDKRIFGFCCDNVFYIDASKDKDL